MASSSKKMRALLAAAAMAAWFGAAAGSAAPGSDRPAAPEPASASAVLSPEAYEEAKARYLALVRDRDPAAALAELADAIDRSGAEANACHELLHELGRASYEKYGDLAAALRFRDEICVSGYVHGVLEAYLGTSVDVFAALEAACSGSAAPSYEGWECFHGIGHGLMYFSGNDLPRSVSLCDGLPAPDWAKGACANGAYMENFNADQEDHVSAYLDPSRPLHPCPEQPDAYKDHCVMNAPIAMLRANGGDGIAALRTCDEAERAFRESCYYGVGAQVARRNIGSPERAEEACIGGGPVRAPSCLVGMVGHYVSTYYDIERTAREVCARLPSRTREACLKILGDRSQPFIGLMEGDAAAPSP
jgi:hypothetical protein